jgi:hypothetical protein
MAAAAAAFLAAQTPQLSIVAMLADLFQMLSRAVDGMRIYIIRRQKSIVYILNATCKCANVAFYKSTIDRLV